MIVGVRCLLSVGGQVQRRLAVSLARRGRGATAFSTALNSNSLNVAAGLLMPAVVIGLAKPTASGALVASCYVGLTALTLLLAYMGRGLGRV